MANVFVEESTMSAIGDAIRAKTGKSDLILPADMATEISGITTGGGDESDGALKEVLGGTITSVVSDEITTITPDYALAYQKNLTKVDLSNLTTIEGIRSFEGCSALSEVNMPKLQSSGDSTFTNCTSLTSAKLPSLSPSIPSGMFNGCSKLTSLTFSGNITSIGSYAFKGCPITRFRASSLLTVGQAAFNSCTSLASVYMKKVTTVNIDAFRYCSALTAIEFDGSPKIGNYAFQGCSKLHSVIIRGSSVATMNTTTASYKPFYNLSSVYFYVPSSLVSTYKSNTYWSTYSSRIRALEDYYYPLTDYSNTNVVSANLSYGTAASYNITRTLNAGDTVIITINHRDSFTVPDDCQVFGSSNTIESNAKLSFVVYKATKDETKTITITMASSSYNNLNIVVLKNVKSVNYSGNYATISTSCSPTSPIAAPTKPTGQALLWGLARTYWANACGTWDTSTRDIIYLTEDPVYWYHRVANFIDFGDGVTSRTFSPSLKASAGYGTLLDALELEFEE